jgi:hypothetical protein
MALNQAQQNALATTLVHLERSLNDIDRLLDGSVIGVTYITEIDFTPTTVEHLRARCDELRAQIAEMMDAFALPRHYWHGRRVIVGEMSAVWTYLEDMRPHKLRRYGAVDPGLTETLAPRLEQLIRLVRAIQDLASRGEQQ